MRDGPVRRAVKRVARWNFEANLGLHRSRRRRAGETPHLLAGECRRCARCCEAPGIQANRAVWYVPMLRRLFLWWQERVNGFVLVDRDRAQRVFIFRCTHFDPVTRACDSYESRPGLCRDYPRNLLWAPLPEMLPGCGYRAQAPGADGLSKALDRSGMAPERLEKLKRDLRLDG